MGARRRRPPLVDPLRHACAPRPKGGGRPSRRFPWPRSLGCRAGSRPLHRYERREGHRVRGQALCRGLDDSRSGRLLVEDRHTFAPERGTSGLPGQTSRNASTVESSSMPERFGSRWRQLFMADPWASEPTARWFSSTSSLGSGPHSRSTGVRFLAQNHPDASRGAPATSRPADRFAACSSSVARRGWAPGEERRPTRITIFRYVTEPRSGREAHPRNPMSSR